MLKWLKPDSRKQLQRLLWFANFYRRFIWKYSPVAAPLIFLTSSKRPFVWSTEADTPFSKLKVSFTSALILHPDPE